MYCQKCGTEIKDGQTVCPNCGAAAKSSISIKPEIKSINKEFILKNINTILAVIAILLMFLPILTINAYETGYSNKLSISGFDMANGTCFNTGENLDRNFFAWLMFMIPIFSILTNYIKKLFHIKKVTLFLAPLICCACIFLAKSSISSAFKVSLSTAVGFWLYLLVCLFWLIIGFLQYRNLPLNKDSLSMLIKK